MQTGNGITYSFSTEGRLGDNLLAYFHAKWVAYQTKLPFFYVPFPNSDAFCLSSRDYPLSKKFKFKKNVSIHDIKQISIQPASTLFTIPYFPETRFEYRMCGLRLLGIPFFQINWKDPGFRAEVIACLTPVREIKTFDLPKDQITVGVHVRRGGNHDSPEVHRIFPLKFPSDEYYIQQIQKIADLFRNQSLYIHLLTDDFDPEKIIQKYKVSLNNPNLTFGFRKSENSHEALLEDFFTIQKFDCLILSQSNFSLVASKVKEYAVLITPAHATLVNNQWVIDQVDVNYGLNAR